MMNMDEINNLINITKKYLIKYDYEKVIKSCDKILEIDPGSSFGLRFKAISYIKTGKYEEGLKYYSKLNKIYPDDKDIISTLAYLNEKIGNYDEALKLYDKIIKKYPTGHFRKRLLTKIKRYDILIDECDKQISTIKKDEICANNKILGLLEEKAVYLYRNGQYDESYNTFKKALEIYPESKNGFNPYKKDPQWYIHLEECLNKYSDSEEFFNEFFKVDNYHIWYRKLSRSYAEGYNFVYADTLIEKNPQNTDILDKIAKISESFDIDYSLDCYYRILEVEPENKTAVNSIISLYENNYNKDKAIKFIDSKLNSPILRLSLLRQKIDILESMTLYEEALKCYDEYMTYEHINESEFTKIIFDKLICMELYALELYNEKNYEKAYRILSEISSKFHNITGNENYELSDWYNNVLRKSLDKSNDNPKIFFKQFYEPDKKQTESWIRKINYMEYKYTPLKNMGYKTYPNILFGENPTNYLFLMNKARKYYTGVIKPYEALPIFNQILEINPYNQEILNQKFNMLISSEQYEEAYELFKEIKIDYPVIYYKLDKFVDYLINNREYDRAKYCLNRLLIERWTRKELKKLKMLWDKSDDIESQNESSYYMDWISLINFKHEKCICPECHGKLMPIKYGLIIETIDSDFSSNQCYASEKINILKYRPTDYCPECKKE
ncbi:MAG: tetratricopeptide repeat protein, partial [Methanobrevibacter olleyae]|nr:tetratricopeptide repeat protein [Methanobrevibacter olleyae]